MKAATHRAPLKSFGLDGRAIAYARYIAHKRNAALIRAACDEAEEHALHVQALLRRPTMINRSDLLDAVMALEYRCDEAGARITALEQQILRLMERR